VIVLHPLLEARKAAQRERYRKWRNTAAGREAALANKRKWDAENAEHRREYRKQCRAEHAADIRLANRRRYNAPGKAEHRRALSLWSNYRLTVEVYERMMSEQGGLCAVCQTEPAAHVDHCHATGVVRGILCANCNKGLGCFRDDTARMQRACRYLQAVTAKAACGDMK